MKTPPAVGNSPLRSELELLRPITPGRENWVISLVRILEEGRPGEVRLLVRRLDPMRWEEELAAAAKAKVAVDGPQAMERILEKCTIHKKKINRAMKLYVHIHNRNELKSSQAESLQKHLYSWL